MARHDSEERSQQLRLLQEVNKEAARKNPETLICSCSPVQLLPCPSHTLLFDCHQLHREKTFTFLSHVSTLSLYSFPRRVFVSE